MLAIMDRDEFKRIKFRNNGKVYNAHAVDLSSANTSVAGNFLVWTGAFRIYDEDDRVLVGKICFQQSTLLDYLWADPSKKRFPSKEYLEEALINLLHYLPFDSETLKPDGESFIFRFIRDLEDGRQKGEQTYNIKVENSMEKTYQRKMFGNQISDEKIAKSILEPLYTNRLEDYSKNVPTELLTSILPFDKNKICSYLEILEYKDLVEILRDSNGNYIRVKIRPEGVKYLLGETFKSNASANNIVKNIQIGHKFNINTGNNSPVNINADIDTSFSSVKKEIEEKNPKNKVEILKDLSLLQEEIKKPSNIDKVRTLLGNLGRSAEWVGRRVEPIVQQVIASYISSQLPIPPIK
jgi:hypothetical protein